jgi:heme-degrading monooxygenase HmoA
MIAAISIVTGPALGMADYARIAREAIEGWLRGYDGYRGLIVFTDEDGQRARIVTLWETPEDEMSSRQGRSAMRDRVAAGAGMVVEGVELYEVPVCEILPGHD